MFTIEMLPAEFGDCLWIEYGSGSELHRVIIDGGTKPTGGVLGRRILQLDPADRRFELMVVTHIDADHIDGVVQLLNHPPEGLHIGEFWFNAYRHLPAKGILGPQVGEYLTVLLEKMEQKQPELWNRSFQGNAVMLPDAGEPPSVMLDGDMRLLVLGPTLPQLRRLRREWDVVMQDLAGVTDAAAEALSRDRRFRKGWLGPELNIPDLATSEFEEDTAPANGSSIVLLAEYEGHRCLFAADAFPSSVVSGLERLHAQTSRGRLELSACKVPHHGSQNNNSNELYAMLECPNYLVSTNGAHYDHPDREGIARILYNKKNPAALLFNYRSPLNEIWDEEDLRHHFRYSTRFPEQPGMKLTL